MKPSSRRFDFYWPLWRDEKIGTSGTQSRLFRGAEKESRVTEGDLLCYNNFFFCTTTCLQNSDQPVSHLKMTPTKRSFNKIHTVFPHIVAAATILFWIHLVRKLFKFSFPLCNENLNSFLTRWGNYSRRGNYSREETKWGNTVIKNHTFKLSPIILVISTTYITGWSGNLWDDMLEKQS